MWIQWPFFFQKTWTKGHWPQDDLWPQVCWSHMYDSTQGSLCPSPTKIHQSMWIQWPFFAKTWTKGHWPLDDLWPHVCQGHMCDSTQGSLCPSPMEIHQCLWIQWSILQNYHIHNTYRMSDHVVSYWIQFRRDKTKNKEIHRGKDVFCSPTCILSSNCGVILKQYWENPWVKESWLEQSLSLALNIKTCGCYFLQSTTDNNFPGSLHFYNHVA